MNDLSTIMSLLSNAAFSEKIKLDFNHPKRNPEQLEALHQVERYTSNEMETRPENIRLMARLLRSATKDEDNPLQMAEVEQFGFWLENEMNLLGQIQYQNADAVYCLTEHLKAGGQPFESDKGIHHTDSKKAKGDHHE
ncbi:hypothetical protein [Thiomicrorhabdus indica]|uniref:hypothetical protein n=1 Tax=Thiomicrorhabdus indica TaxID=2267253 RepID=UPI00102DBD9E|nr:hypothetical protein [Thiomicrorhabdus indica]